MCHGTARCSAAPQRPPQALPGPLYGPVGVEGGLPRVCGFRVSWGLPACKGHTSTCDGETLAALALLDAEA